MQPSWPRWSVRLDDLSAMFADGDIDGPQLKRGSAQLHAQLDSLEARIAAARSASAVANLVLAGDDLRATWAASPPDLRGKVIDALMTVTVLPGAVHPQLNDSIGRSTPSAWRCRSASRPTPSALCPSKNGATALSELEGGNRSH